MICVVQDARNLADSNELRELELSELTNAGKDSPGCASAETMSLAKASKEDLRRSESNLASRSVSWLTERLWLDGPERRFCSPRTNPWKRTSLSKSKIHKRGSVKSVMLEMRIFPNSISMS